MSCHAGENADKTQLRRTRLIGVNGEFIEMDLTRIKQEAGSESDSDIEKVVLGLDSEGEAEEERDAAGGSCLRQSRCTFPGSDDINTGHVNPFGAGAALKQAMLLYMTAQSEFKTPGGFIHWRS